MTPHPTPEPPQGYEQLTEPFLRKHGAVEGMKTKNPHFPKQPWLDSQYSAGETMDFGGNDDVEKMVYIAPLGTMAAATTPLPEARCKCGNATKNQVTVLHQQGCDGKVIPYRHILPGELAKMETRPEGLLCANPGRGDWSDDVATCMVWPWTEEDWDAFSPFAYALPLQPSDIAQDRAEVLALAHTEFGRQPPAVGEEELRVRVRVAEWMGYEKQTRNEMWWHREKGHYYSLNELPAYTTSLDAIASAEAKLTDTQHNAYRLQIIHTLAEDQGVPWSEIYGNGRAWFSAPPRIRATALYRLLQTIEEKEQRQ